MGVCMSSVRETIIQGINQHLIDIGYSTSNSALSAQKGWEFFERQICNSRDPFKDSCDHAGAHAQTAQPKVKYKSPKGKTKARTKKPQEAFNFGA